MVKIGKACRECRFYGFQTQSCDYALIMKRSRTITNGVQINSEYCDKYEKGQREIDPNDWIKTEFQLRKANRERKKHG